MLTPQQAASHARVSRGTIMNAIKHGYLSARRDNRNHWQIHPSDLSKWLSDRSDIATVKAVNSDSQQVPSPDENLIRIAMLEAELKGKDQRISDLSGTATSGRRRPRSWRAAMFPRADCFSAPPVVVLAPGLRRVWPEACAGPAALRRRAPEPSRQGASTRRNPDLLDS